MSPEERRSLLDRWQLTELELTEIVEQNPSMRGLMLGYIAEYKLRKMYFAGPEFTGVHKADDHDRCKKGDLTVTFEGREFRIECKSLQTNSVKKIDDAWQGKYQCDASDRRQVKYGVGLYVETTCLLVNEFDIIAVNLFAFNDEWRFGFALNEDHPRSTYKKYAPDVQKMLLATLMPVSWPLLPPYVDDPKVLLRRLLDRA